MQGSEGNRSGKLDSRVSFSSGAGSSENHQDLTWVEFWFCIHSAGLLALVHLFFCMLLGPREEPVVAQSISYEPLQYFTPGQVFGPVYLEVHFLFDLTDIKPSSVIHPIPRLWRQRILGSSLAKICPFKHPSAFPCQSPSLFALLGNSLSFHLSVFS